jgi:hypothetical protein
MVFAERPRRGGPRRSNAGHLEDIEWPIGECTGETEKGESAEATYEWAENQNLIGYIR